MAQLGSPLLTLEQACSALFAGKLLIFPTETFYALGCDAMNPDAVGAVFSLKKRPLNMPLPVVIGSRAMLSGLVTHVPEEAAGLMDAFWPGPLSLCLSADPEVPDLLTANAHRIAVRVSSHPAVSALCEASGKVLAASSANISGTVPVSDLAELAPELAHGVAGIFSAGPAPVGDLPSTVVELRNVRGESVVRVLRKGAISLEALQQAGFTVQDASESRPEAPPA